LDPLIAIADPHTRAASRTSYPIAERRNSIMPIDRIQPETDGDPRTVLEDTKNHERVGFELTEDEYNQDHEEGYQPKKNRP
jgi:hypothetical protein